MNTNQDLIDYYHNRINILQSIREDLINNIQTKSSHTKDELDYYIEGNKCLEESLTYCFNQLYSLNKDIN